MLNNRYGQAKILSNHDIPLLLEYGLQNFRDKALFAFCFYTACRLSEARRMHHNNVFQNGTVLDAIVIPKAITKGQQSTRTIPTHPNLAKILREYRETAIKLNEVKEETGDWSHLSMDRDGKIQTIQGILCPYCSSNRIFKSGVYRRNADPTFREQFYLCKDCNKSFRESQAGGEHSRKHAIATFDNFGVKDSKNFGLLYSYPDNPFLFPGRGGKGCLTLSGAFNVFKTAFRQAGIIGASSHSCRRTALTIMHSEGVTLRVLQEISGHRDLGALQRYLEVTQEELEDAINLLGMDDA